MSKIRVITYNIKYDNPNDKNNPWELRKEMVADVIRFHSVDLAGLQEVLKNQLDDLEELLPEYGWVGVGRDDGTCRGEFTPIFYFKKRFELLSSGTFWLSPNPDKPGSRGWDALCRRIVTWAEFKDKILNSRIYHFNTHFDHLGFRARCKSAYLLLNKIQEISKGDPIIVTGDFNCNENSKAYKILTGYDKENQRKYLRCGYLKNVRYESTFINNGPAITYHGYRAAQLFRLIGKPRYLKGIIKKICSRMSIDFIFIKNHFKVYQYGILSDIWSGKYPSDHFPAAVDMLLLRRG